MFKVNQKVICINDNFDRERQIRNGETYPIKGKIYKVRENYKDSIRLFEIQNPIQQYYNVICETAFFNFRFKAVDYSFAEGILEEISKAVNEECILN